MPPSRAPCPDDLPRFRPVPVGARAKLLEAAVKLIRTHGFAATSVDELCREAGVTKGAFFHHFPTKEAIGVAVADYWSQSTSGFFANAPFQAAPAAIDRVLGYIDLRARLIDGPVEGFSCVAGTMVQEAFRSSDAIRAACNASMTGNVAQLERDMAEAMADHGVTGIDPAGLALHVQATLQGGFILAKARDDSGVAKDTIAHLRRYIEYLFGLTPRVGQTMS